MGLENGCSTPITLTIAGSGNNYTAFASNPCKRLMINNTSGVDLGIIWNSDQGVADTTNSTSITEFKLLSGTSFTIRGLINTNNVLVRKYGGTSAGQSLHGVYERGLV